MAQPIEIRQYLRRFTLDDLRDNRLQPIRLPGPDNTSELYAPPVFQYRCREKVYVNGEATLQWTPWIDIAFVREGVDDPA